MDCFAASSTLASSLLASCWYMSFSACNRSTRERNLRYSGGAGCHAGGSIFEQYRANSSASISSVLLRLSSLCPKLLGSAGFTTLTSQPASANAVAQPSLYVPADSMHTCVDANWAPRSLNQAIKATNPEGSLAIDLDFTFPASLSSATSSL